MEKNFKPDIWLIPLLVIAAHLFGVYLSWWWSMANKPETPPQLTMIDLSAFPADSGDAGEQGGGDSSPAPAAPPAPKAAAKAAAPAQPTPKPVSKPKPDPVKPKPDPVKPKPDPIQSKPVAPTKPPVDTKPTQTAPNRTDYASANSNSQATGNSKGSNDSNKPSSGNGKGNSSNGQSSTPGAGNSRGSGSGGGNSSATHIGGYLNNPKPPYPALSRENGEEGRVGMRVVVEPNGSPSSVQVASSSGFPRLDRSALAAVKKYRFRPATRNGQPIRSTYTFNINFSL